MSFQGPEINSADDKVMVDHVEQSAPADEKIDIHSGEGLRSKWEDVDVYTTVKVFKKAVFICIAAAVSAACDGFQVGGPNSPRWSRV